VTNTFLQRYRKLPRAGRIGLIAALLLVLYGLLGSFLLPHLLKPRLIEAVSTLTGREASLAELRINPYTLRVEARGFLLRDHEGARFVGFEQLEVDLQASSLLRRAWTFRRVALTAPTVEILRQ
jgi:uncharacterized protein involved in outer membrane biogenesis